MPDFMRPCGTRTCTRTTPLPEWKSWLDRTRSYPDRFTSPQERVEADYASRLAAVLAGSVRGINRTDAHTLGTSFGSLADMMRCKDADAFSACPGIGPTKVRTEQGGGQEVVAG